MNYKRFTNTRKYKQNYNKVKNKKLIPTLILSMILLVASTWGMTRMKINNNILIADILMYVSIILLALILVSIVKIKYEKRRSRQAYGRRRFRHT